MRVAIIGISSNLYFIKSDLGISNSQGGLLTSAPLVFMGIFALTVNQVQKRLGQRWGIGVFLALMGLVIISRIWMTAYWQLLASAAIAGMCIAIIGPLLSGFIKLHFPNDSSKYIALYTTMMGIGQTIISGVSPQLINRFESWQMTIGIWGFFTVAVAVLWLFIAPSEDDAPEIADIPRQSIGRTQADFSTGSMWRNPLIWQMMVIYSAQAACNYSFSTWLQPYVVSQGHTAEFGSLLISILTVAQTISNFVVLGYASRQGRLKSAIALCGISMAVGGTLIFLGNITTVFLTIGVILVSFGGTGCFNLSLLIPIRVSGSAQEASVMTSMMQTVGYAVAATAPLLVGTIMDITGFMNILVVLILAMAIVVISSSRSNVVDLANQIN